MSRAPQPCGPGELWSPQLGGCGSLSPGGSQGLCSPQPGGALFPSAPGALRVSGPLRPGPREALVSSAPGALGDSGPRSPRRGSVSLSPCACSGLFPSSPGCLSGDPATRAPEGLGGVWSPQLGWDGGAELSLLSPGGALAPP